MLRTAVFATLFTSALADTPAQCTDMKALYQDSACCGGTGEARCVAPGLDLAGLDYKLDAIAADQSSCAQTTLPITAGRPALAYVDLTQADFAKGTYRATAPGVYRLTEDIVFEPDLNDQGEHWPSCETAEKAAAYCENGRPAGPYHLGFFAALTLEGSDVHLDLNGYTLSQSLLHSLKQRFFAVVETGSAPFLPGQGPGNFGNNTVGCRYCSVTNGNLGRSSHHGIHGLRNEDLTIRGVTFQDYEVAAISLNGPQRVLIENVEVVSHSTTIHSRATLSATRFLLNFVNQAFGGVTAAGFGASIPASLTAAATHLQSLEDAFIASILNNAPLAATDEAQRLFGNVATADGLVVDGNAYGIVIHGRGVLVNQFAESQSPDFTEDAQDVTIQNVNINNVLARVNEVVTIKMPTSAGDAAGKPMVDVAGSVIRIDEQYDAAGMFQIDALHALRFEYANFISFIPAELAGHLTGTLRIDGALATAFVAGTLDEAGLNNYAKACNADSMFHAQKGVVGLFVQKASRVSVRDVSINGVRNNGELGSDACGAYTTSQWPGHVGYTGSQSFGLVVTSSKDVNIRALSVDGVFSLHSTAYGAALFNDVDQTCFSNVMIKSVGTGSALGPNDPPLSLPLLVGADVTGFAGSTATMADAASAM